MQHYLPRMLHLDIERTPAASGSDPRKKRADLSHRPCPAKKHAAHRSGQAKQKTAIDPFDIRYPRAGLNPALDSRPCPAKLNVDIASRLKGGQTCAPTLLSLFY